MPRSIRLPGVVPDVASCSPHAAAGQPHLRDGQHRLRRAPSTDDPATTSVRRGRRTGHGSRSCRPWQRRGENHLYVMDADASTRSRSPTAPAHLPGGSNAATASRSLLPRWAGLHPPRGPRTRTADERDPAPGRDWRRVVTDGRGWPSRATATATGRSTSPHSTRRPEQRTQDPRMIRRLLALPPRPGQPGVGQLHRSGAGRLSRIAVTSADRRVLLLLQPSV